MHIAMLGNVMKMVRKVFGEWSNVYPFSVTAITPDTPEILSVKTKGSTITVTYKRIR